MFSVMTELVENSVEVSHRSLQYHGEIQNRNIKHMNSELSVKGQ